MVVLVDLESDEENPSLLARYAQRRGHLMTSDDNARRGNEQDAREAGFAAVLTCYPYANTIETGRKTIWNR